MKRAFILALSASLSAAAALGSSLTIGTGTYAENPPAITWYGNAFYLNDQGGPGIGVSMSGNLSLFNFYNDTVDNVPWTTFGGSWEGIYTTSLDWGTCYSTGMNARTFDQYSLAYGNSTCNPETPPSSDDGTVLAECGADNGCAEPLVINLGGGPYRLTGLDDPVSFDIHADRHRLSMGWTARNADIAFVALDLNGNGVIDDGSELFGNASPLRNGTRAANGFEALAQYDANGDGIIDRRDPIWQSLLLWIDRNHNGISEPEELQRIASSSVTGIYLSHHWTNRRDASGNFFGYQGHLKIGDELRVFYDVFFVTAPK